MGNVEFDFFWDVQRLHSSFRSSQYFAKSGGIDHMHDCPSDDFYFSSILFPKEVESEKDLLACAVEATNSKVKYFERLLQGSLAMLSADDRWPLFIERDGRAIKAEPRPFSLKSIDFEEFNNSELLVQHAVLALGVEEYARILLFFQRANTWGEWYKVMECIIQEYPQLKKKKETNETPSGMIFDAKELGRFTYTANNPQIIGLDARHGGIGRGVSNKMHPMTKTEGHRFIKAMTLAYANDKAKKYHGWR